jgi:proline dehydrogenase
MNEVSTLPSFDNTKVAFAHKSNFQLRKAQWLFRSFNSSFLLNNGAWLSKLTLALGLKGIIKSTIFEQFCGGESMQASESAIAKLHASGIGTILDYSVEGEETEAAFDQTAVEIIETIAKAAQDSRIPFSVFKVTGIVSFDLLQAKSEGRSLNENEEIQWERGKARFDSICQSAYNHQVRLFVDAEESWIQDAIDRLTEEAMELYNKEFCIVYNTIQLYRHDRLAYLQEQSKKSSLKLGFKLVRGAYMEKERARAIEMGYSSPIQKDKESTDRDYNAAVSWCLEHSHISICIGTHNEASSLMAAEWLQTHGETQGARVYFSQLLGMSDHISYNLAHSGFNVAKYVPYGPISAVMPYLLRRAQENTSAKGQAGRELSLIEKEMKRRKQ